MALITSSIKIYVDYMFSPYFGQVKTMPDVIAYLESYVRLILFLLMMIALYKGTSIRILVFTYLGLTLMWSVGVISYGAAIRHHVLTNWILVIVSMYVIAELNKHYKRLDKN
jgi:peptidoglycan/LPS O-acetylase OafA/YrhL